MAGAGPRPAVTIEAEDLEAVLRRAAAAGLSPESGPADEPSGGRRAFLRDRCGKLLDVMVHRAP